MTGLCEERMDRAREFAEQRAGDLREVASTVVGRRFLWWLIDEVAGVCNGSFTGEPLTSAYQEGRRAVGRELMAAVQTFRALYCKMVTEAARARELEGPGNDRKEERCRTE